MTWRAAPPPAHPSRRLGQRVGRLAAGLWQRLDAANRARREDDCLRRMTDHQLRDIGLARVIHGNQVRFIRLDQCED